MSRDGLTALLFWDIDGTLLTTGRAGIHAWEDAASEEAGYRVDLQHLISTGLTDYAVGTKILEQLHLHLDGVRLSRLVRRYEERLPASLPKRQGRVLDGVRELLEFLHASRPDVRSYLLTGNTRMGARAKLTYYHLYDFFAGGAYAADAADRATIARRALDLASNGEVPLERVYVIGDTPHDVECGRAIGARTLALATGEYTADALRAHDPWSVLERLPDPQSFLGLIVPD